MAQKLYIKTYGCQMNEYDSDKMADILHHTQGMELTAAIETADVLLLNTCSIREKAQEKVFSDLGRFREIKEKNPNVIIGVGGCVASQEGKAILKRAPYVDVIFGPQTLHRLPELIAEAKQKGKAVVDISFPEIEKFDRLPEPRANGLSAFVSIMEGCSKYCSFCVVPYTRGEEVSRPFDDVIAEIAALASQGVKEITLLGQNVNDYQGLMHNGSYADLALLIHYIAAMDEILRIRFTTSHPNAFSDHLIQAFAEEPKLANHLHLPVQSGSDRILMAMKRNYTVLEYKTKLRKLRQVRPDITLSTDIIVGFPGETEAEFMATVNLVQEIGFDHSFCFIYSPRPGTPAAQFPDDVDSETKKNRLNILQQRLQCQVQDISRKMINSIQNVFITQVSKRNPNLLQGRTENNRMVDIAMTTPLQVNSIGEIKPVKITQALTYSLIGEFI